jgi:hypothetical protein
MADELEPIRQNIEINVNEKGVDEATGDIGKLNTTISSTTTATSDLAKENKKAEESFKPLKTQLKEARELLQKMSAQYGATSAQATQAAQAVAGISDEIGFQRDLVDSYNPDDNFRALTQTAGLAALALGGVKDGLAAVGIESKFLDQVIGTAQALLGVTSAIGGISDAYGVLTASQRAASASAVVAAGTTEALAVAETQATVATWSWNSALLANPIVLIAAAVVAAGVAIYAFVKITSDAVKEEEKAKVASMQLNDAIDKQTTAFDSNSKESKTNSDYKIALLRASGASEAQIYRETKAIAEQETKQKKLNSAKADAILIAAELNFRNAKSGSDAEAQAKKDLDRAIEFSQAQASQVSGSYQNQIKIIQDNEIAITQAKTDARNKAIEEEKKAQEKAKSDTEKLAKEKADAAKKASEDDAKAFADRVEKGKKDTEDQNKADAENKARQLEDIEKQFESIAVVEQEAADKSKEIEQAKLDQKKAIQDAEINIAERGIQLIASVFGKSKAVQKGAIIAENAIGIGKQVIANNTANAGALATPQAIATSGASAVPVIALNNISTGIGIAASVAATAKALSAVGGGGTTGASGAQAQPSRNVAQVGFQGSSENQISTAIAQKNKDQPPIQAFVVSQAVTDQQEIDRKKELQNSF